jgi:CubicO group peptidase (beta-lactamase class C family)
MRLPACLLAVLGAAASTAAAQTPHRDAASPRAEPYPGLDAYVQAALATWNVPGAALAIVRHDSVIYTHGYGVRTAGTRDPVDDRTIFAIGSCSKAFTSAAIAMLVDDGKVQWDAHVTTYLPGFQLADPYVTREITVRDLLTHRSGLDRGELVWYESDFPRDTIIRHLRYLRQATSFRYEFGYNNLMYLTAGQVLAAASGMSWDDFITRRVFEPLEMRSSSTSITALAGQTDIASGHRTTHGAVHPVPWYNADNIAPAGSINSNVRDMAQWLRFQLAHGTVSGKTLVSAGALNVTHTPQTILPLGSGASPLYPTTHFLNYGMGWLVYDYKGHVALAHTGGIDGFRALVAFLPDDDFGFVILTNEESTVVYNALAAWLFDRQLRQPAHDWSADMHKVVAAGDARDDSTDARAQRQRVTGTHPTLDLSRYAGRYSDSAYGTATVTLDAGTLTFTRGRLIGDLESWNYDTFRATWRAGVLDHSLVTFDVTGTGTVGSLRVDLGGDTVIFRRSPDAPDTTSRVTVAAATLSRYVGPFHATGLPVTMTVQMIDGALHATIPGQPAFTLMPLSARRFQLAGAGVPGGFFLEFTLHGDAVTGATLEQPQPQPTVTFVAGAA